MVDPLPPQLLREVTERAKRQLRQRLKAVRASYPKAALARRSGLIQDKLDQVPELAGARAVALFHPILERGEVDLRAYDAALRSRGVRVYYPFMTPIEGGGYSTGFRATQSLSELEAKSRGFLEPPIEGAVALRGDLDVVIVPALAADGRGQRLGYGMGYYDATLGDVVPEATTVIVVYDFQLLAEIPSEPHDVPCDVVVSDERILRPQRDP